MQSGMGLTTPTKDESEEEGQELLEVSDDLDQYGGKELGNMEEDKTLLLRSVQRGRNTS